METKRVVRKKRHSCERQSLNEATSKQDVYILIVCSNGLFSLCMRPYHGKTILYKNLLKRKNNGPM